MELFTHSKINDNLYQISDIAKDLFYLIVGEKECTLLDCGLGYGSIVEYVKGITDKPITTVLLTHGHVDHAGGAGEFSNVYLHKADHELALNHTSDESRLWYLGKAGNKELLIPQKKNYQELKHGDVFKVDGQTIEVYECKGHTQGSVMFHLKEMDMLLLGDACNAFTFLFLEESSDLHTYREEISKYVDFKCETVLFSHGNKNGTVKIFRDALNTCDALLSHELEGTPAPQIGVLKDLIGERDIRLALKMNEHFEIENGSEFNAVFDASKL